MLHKTWRMPSTDFSRLREYRCNVWYHVTKSSCTFQKKCESSQEWIPYAQTASSLSLIGSGVALISTGTCVTLPYYLPPCSKRSWLLLHRWPCLAWWKCRVVKCQTHKTPLWITSKNESVLFNQCSTTYISELPDRILMKSEWTGQVPLGRDWKHATQVYTFVLQSPVMRRNPL